MQKKQSKKTNSLLKPNHLKNGDKIMLISPSSGLANIQVFHHRVKKGIETLQKMGFQVIVGSNAQNADFDRAGTIKQRVMDIHTGFSDPNIKAIISMIGGNDVAAELLPHLDFQLIKTHPKIFMGYSDISTLLLSIYKKTGLVTFHGPCLMTELGEYPKVFDYTIESMKKTLMDTRLIGAITYPPTYTDEFLDWSIKLDQTRPRKMQQSDGWKWLQNGYATGPLLGGCIQTIFHMLKNYPEYVPDFSGSILFIESSEKGIGKQWSPKEVMDYLLKLKKFGLFKDIAGLVIGRPYKYEYEAHLQLIKYISALNLDKSMPIVYNIPIGHTDPIATLPIGIKATIDSKQSTFTINESAVI